jgi:hypothetical protein
VSSANDISNNNACADDSFRSKLSLLNRIFCCEQFINRVYLNLGMLFTFGLASPLLVVGIVFDCWSNLWVMKLFILKYLSDFHASTDTVATEDHSCDGVAHNVLLCNSIRSMEMVSFEALGMVFIVTICFWSIFAFDMIGDVYGQVTGLTALVVVPSVVIANTFAVLYLFPRYCGTTSIERLVTSTEKVCETRMESTVEMNQRFSFADN